MAKKKNGAIPSLRKRIRGTVKELQGVERDLARAQATLQRYLNRTTYVRGEDEYFADLRALIGKRR